MCVQLSAMYFKYLTKYKSYNHIESTKIRFQNWQRIWWNLYILQKWFFTQADRILIDLNIQIKVGGFNFYTISQVMNQNEQNWMPLQSNPEVINPFIEKMGLKVNQFCFQEMLSTQDWAIEMIPQPVLGIVMLYELSPVQTEFKQEQEQTLDPQAVPNNVFFMKQFAHNACGTIALFHTIINALESYPQIVVPGSYLQKFKNESQGKDSKERGEIFKNSSEIKNEHKSASSQGQSSVQASVDSHFIAFISKNGNIYELDGMKKAPVNHGPCAPQDFLTKGSAEIKKFMERDPDNLNFSMIVLAKKQE